MVSELQIAKENLMINDDVGISTIVRDRHKAQCKREKEFLEESFKEMGDSEIISKYASNYEERIKIKVYIDIFKKIIDNRIKELEEVEKVE